MKVTKIKAILLTAILTLSIFTLAMPMMAVSALEAVVYVDDTWTNQATVDVYDDTLTWDTDAFDTIQEGIAAVAVSGTVYVLAGTYDPGTKMHVAKAGITLRGNIADPSTVIITGGSVVDAAVHIEASDITFEGFTVAITNSKSGMWIWYDPDGVTVQHNTFTSDAVADCGIQITFEPGGGYEDRYAEDDLVFNNTITGFFNGINMQESAVNTVISNNTLIDLSEGIWVGGGESGYHTTGTTITGNLITSGGTGIALGLGQGGGVYITDTWIAGNNISYNTGDGIKFDTDCNLDNLTITG